MNFEKPLQPGVLIKRYKRFLADILWKNELITAYVPNTGSMTGLSAPNTPCLISQSNNPNRKLKYTLEMVKAPSSWVGVNTHLPNALVWESWLNHSISGWKKWKYAQKEVPISKGTRIDMVLWNKTNTPIKKFKISLLDQGKFHFVEIKSVTLAEGNKALFPDAVTVRGLKHIHELLALIEQGHSAELIFVVQREDCESFSPAPSIDPEYTKALQMAYKKGLKIQAWPCSLSKKSLQLHPNKALKIIL